MYITHFIIYRSVLITSQQPDVPQISTALYSLYILHIYTYIYNVVPEGGLESPKHVEHPKIKTSYKNVVHLVGSFPYCRHVVCMNVYLKQYEAFSVLASS